MGIHSVMSTWVLRHPTHRLAGLGSMGVPHWQHRILPDTDTSSLAGIASITETGSDLENIPRFQISHIILKLSLVSQDDLCWCCVLSRNIVGHHMMMPRHVDRGAMDTTDISVRVSPLSTNISWSPPMTMSESCSVYL